MIFGFGKKAAKVEKQDDEEEELDFVQFQGALNGVTPDLGANAKLVQAGLVPAKRLISQALARRAEMIRLDTKGKVAGATLFVDGVSSPGERMPAQMALAITQVLKLLAGLDIKVRNKPQVGGINASYDDIPYEIRINTQPVEGVERLLIRARNTKIKLDSPRELGFPDALIDKIREVTSRKQGLVIVAGPPYSGLTTATIATVRSTDAYLYSIYSLLQLEERELSHITSFKWNEGDDLAQTMRRAVREDADVLYVDPLNKPENVKTVLEFTPSISVIAEVTARDAAEGLYRLVQYSGDPQAIADNVKLALSQMLVRLLCKKCRRAYRPNPKLLAKVGLPPETKVLYHPPRPDEEEEGKKPGEPVICDACGGTGYRGRTGLMEVIEMTEGMQKVILAGADPKALRAQARAEKMQSFQSDGIRLAAEGLTSLEELQRAFKSHG
ncbi:ATPase, T2SS/T4P/T4SS family [Planctomicrobium sp. SH664]|uniref:ATPase, T2SS/T4P/T4SS family n=1 Tax=Planctomicrobium sp. SH664 TaxID=3448125 RepID=UPI003F5BE478